MKFVSVSALAYMPIRHKRITPHFRCALWVHLFPVEQARILLTRLKINKTLKFTFVLDDQEVSKLPAWVKTAKQITDGHLVQVAKAHGAVLATLDRKIPTALVIPPTPEDEAAQQFEGIDSPAEYRSRERTGTALSPRRR
jgi:hypothetical protein